MDTTVRKLAEKINIAGSIRLSEPMSLHTTFEIGGPADIYAAPATKEDLRYLVRFSREHSLSRLVIGGGANILVADAGIRGLVIDISKLDTVTREGNSLIVEAGRPISDVSLRAAEEGLSGLEFIYRMPGSTGGALWMNARCYGRSISEAIEWIEYIDDDGADGRIDMPHPGFAYKRSPFQSGGHTIFRASFGLSKADEQEIRRKMDEVFLDRKRKGHFLHPSAGSIFKNDRSLGKPTGAILDELGLKGKRIGNAQIAPFHANIIINLGSAKARDVRELIDSAARLAREQLGVELEPEIRLIGKWGDGS